MHRSLCCSGLLLGALFHTACTSDQVAEASPTVRLFRGELHPDDYTNELTRANEEVRDTAQFDINRQPTRAYNTVSGAYEYVPEDTEQRWNEAEQRWEFTPVVEREDAPVEG